MHSNTQLIKQLAVAMGFDYCGIAQAKELTEDAIRLEQWLHKGYHGEMEYMAKNFDLRIDPRKLVPGAKSVICFIKNYYPSEAQEKVSLKLQSMHGEMIITKSSEINYMNS